MTSNWTIENQMLYKHFNFQDFTKAFGFMTQVAFLAEKHQHHPTWKNTYGKVEIWLTTHDAGHIITEKDHALAKDIDQILNG